MKLRPAVLVILALLFVLHMDLWWWDADDRVLGLPIGIAWQLGLCFAVAVVMALFTRNGERES